jgi:uncharacterized protein
VGFENDPAAAGRGRDPSQRWAPTRCFNSLLGCILSALRALDRPIARLALPETRSRSAAPHQSFLPAVFSTRCSLEQRMFEFPDAKNVAILGDTHGLLRPELSEHLSGTDLILHSGDVGQITVLHRLKQYAPVIAVRGNVDDHIEGLRETELVSIRGHLVYVLHVLANLDLDPAVAGLAMVVSGHSHQPLIRKAKEVLYVNPGSVGPRRFKLPVSFVRAEFGEISIESHLIQLL